MKDKIDVYQAITDKLVAQLEAGASEFRMPWARSNVALHRPDNVLSKKRYKGINIVSLWCAAMERNYRSATWGTYRQWSERGAQVRKGEKGSMVVVYKEYEADPDPRNPDDDGKRLFARASWVFNAEQVDGYELPALPDMLGPIDRIKAADDFIAGTGATIHHGGQRACYTPALDYIQMPDEGLFRDTDGSPRNVNYYSTAFHELTHWSGAKHRLNRELRNKFGDPKYALEELIAELGAAFLCGSLGLSHEPRKDHAGYVANWLQALKGDKRAIFTAASKASAAADYLETLAAQPRQIAA